MKIIGLQAENVKAIKAVEILPDSSLVQITGKNGQGKSSILDAIWWALSGTKQIQAVPIRKGEDKARIRLDLGELVVERRFTPAGTSLTVQNAEGAKYSSPQGMLDDLLGALSFDPLAFVNEKPADQVEMLKGILGLNFDEIDREYKSLYDQRADENRRAKDLRAQADGITIMGDAPAERINVDSLADEIGRAADHNASIAERQANRTSAVEKIQSLKSRSADLRAEADRLDEEASSLQSRLDGAKDLPDPIDVDDLRAKLNDANAKNAAFENSVRRLSLEDSVNGHEKKSQDLTACMLALKSKKTDMIESSDMPVDGIDFGDGVVMLDGVPFDQASTAQQLRSSVALAMAANPKLKVIRIKQGAFLDEDSLSLIAEMAEERDYQIWVERVDSSGSVGIVIKDGAVASVNDKAA